MSNDASLPPNAPMINGVYNHREVDASSSSSTKNPQSIQSLQDVCKDLNSRVDSFLNANSSDEIIKRTQEQTRIALEVIEKALRDYEFNTISISYNGGKDCLVLLILYLAVLHTHFTQPTGRRKDGNKNEDVSPPSNTFPTSIPSIYAKPPDPFPSVTSFVESSSSQYHLDLTHISTNPGPKPTSKLKTNLVQNLTSHPPVGSQIPEDTTTTTTNHQHDDEKAKIITFRDAFAMYLSTHPQIKAIFVGTRRTDPHGNHLTHFDPTDRNWPAFMRIHPVIDWRLCEIWCFLRSPHLKDPLVGSPLQYCPMYDQGYTSLGGVNDTLRNPKLRYWAEDVQQERYRPAYELVDDQEERLGRE